MKRDILHLSKVIPIEQILDFEYLVVVVKAKTDPKPAAKISNPNASLIGATDFSSSSDNYYLENLTTITQKS